MNALLPAMATQKPVASLDFTWMITGVLYHGGGDRLLEMLHQRGVNEAFFYNVSGSAIGRRIIAGGLGESFDVERFHIVVAADQADSMFEEIYEFCDMDKPNKGIIFMERLERSTASNLPADITLNRATD